MLQLVASYLDGTTIKELAQQFEVHRDTVFEHVRRQGLPFRRNVYARLTDQQIAEAVKMYQSGMSLRAVGRQLKVSADTARKVLVEAGVTLRSRSGRSDP